jgi:phosphoesterase RecJ-like protein
MGRTLRDEAAACLYAGVVTDTGRFQYQAVTPETLRVGADLREYRFDHARLAQHLFEDNTLPYLKVMAVALDRLTLVPEVSLVWTHLTKDDLAATSVTLQDTDDLIDVVRTAREADVACVIKQQRDGRFKVSLRSRGSTDVAAVAQAFGGGGHRLAAGYTSKTALQPTADALVEALRRGPEPGA